MPHVDVVRNERRAGLQLIVARVGLQEGELWIEGKAEQWKQLVRRYWHEAGNPPAAEFLGSLRHLMKGDYIFATDPHTEDDCPIAGLVEIESGRV